jgi:hypothetical protein
MHAGQPKAEWSEPAHTSTFSASVPAGADETKESSRRTAATLRIRSLSDIAASRELLADGRPVKLGGRAFDVLMALPPELSGTRRFTKVITPPHSRFFGESS